MDSKKREVYPLTGPYLSIEWIVPQERRDDIGHRRQRVCFVELSCSNASDSATIPILAPRGRPSPHSRWSIHKDSGSGTRAPRRLIADRFFGRVYLRAPVSCQGKARPYTTRMPVPFGIPRLVSVPVFALTESSPLVGGLRPMGRSYRGGPEAMDDNLGRMQSTNQACGRWVERQLLVERFRGMRAAVLLHLPRGVALPDDESFDWHERIDVTGVTRTTRRPVYVRGVLARAGCMLPHSEASCS